MLNKLLGAKTPTGQTPAKKSAPAAKQRQPQSSRLVPSYQMDGRSMVRVLFYTQFVVTFLAIVMIGMIAHFSTSNIRVLATTADKKLIAPPALDVKLGEEIVINWTNLAVSQAMTFGFHDFDLRQAEVRRFFTDAGWESYNRFLKTAVAGRPSINAMIESYRLLQWATPEKPPLLIEQNLVGGVYLYRMRMFMSFSMRTSGNFNVNSQSYPVDVEVRRVPNSVSSDGLAISLWQASGIRPF